MHRTITSALLATYGLGLFLMPLQALAAPPGTLDGSFAYELTADAARKNTIATQSTGKIIIGATVFFDEDSNVYRGIVRINSDGSLDTSFNQGNTGFTEVSQISAITVQSDDKILVAAESNGQYNGTNIPNFFRLNSNGTLDSSFNSGGSGFNSVPSLMLVQPNGKILVVGEFTHYNGNDVPDKIMRLNSNGSVDTTFNTGGHGCIDSISSIALQPDGKILIAGNSNRLFYNDFDTVLMSPGRLNADGTPDTSFGVDLVGASNVNTILVQSDGKILIGGDFDTFNDEEIGSNIARLNSDGTLDSGFDTGAGIGSAGSAVVEKIRSFSDGKIIVAGGGFETYKGQSIQEGILILESNGTRNTTFNSGNSGFDPSGIYDVLQQSDRYMLVYGNIGDYNNLFETSRTLIRISYFSPPATASPPPASSIVLKEDLETDVSSTAQSGVKEVATIVGGKVAASFFLDFSEDTDLSSITVTRNDSQFATVVHGLSSHDGVTGNITMYTKKSDAHTTFRYCAGKTTLGCTAADDWSALWDTSGTLLATNGGFDASPFTLSVAMLEGEQVWKLVGPIASGGQGESNGSVPEFGYLPFIALMAGCAWYLQRKVLA